MKDITEQFSNLIYESYTASKVFSRCNYLIRTEIVDGNKCIAYAGKSAEAPRRGWHGLTAVQLVVKHQIHWYEFTYKADFLACLESLYKKGYEYHS